MQCSSRKARVSFSFELAAMLVVTGNHPKKRHSNKLDNGNNNNDNNNNNNNNDNNNINNNNNNNNDNNENHKDDGIIS